MMKILKRRKLFNILRYSKFWLNNASQYLVSYRTEFEIRIKKEEGVNWGFTEDAWDEDNDFDDIDGSKKPNFLKVS